MPLGEGLVFSGQVDGNFVAVDQKTGKLATYLTEEEITALLAAPDRGT